MVYKAKTDPFLSGKRKQDANAFEDSSIAGPFFIGQTPKGAVRSEHQLEGSFEVETKPKSRPNPVLHPHSGVASIALEFEAASWWYVVVRPFIADASECLVRNGAKI